MVDLKEYLDWYKSIESIDNNLTLANAATTMVEHINNNIQTVNQHNSIALLLVIFLPTLKEPETTMTVMPSLCQILAHLDHKQRFEFAFIVQESIQFSGKTNAERSQFFKTMIQLFQQYLTLQILESEEPKPNSDTIAAIQTLGVFGNAF